jgi:hypothetical protein
MATVVGDPYGPTPAIQLTGVSRAQHFYLPARPVGMSADTCEHVSAGLAHRPAYRMS